MDRFERKNLALAAARRLAFAAALGGCGNVIVTEEPLPVLDPPPPADDPAPAITVDPPVLPVPKPPAAIDCPAYVADNLPVEWTGEPPTDPKLEACCDELLKGADWGVDPPAPVSVDMLWQCCSVTGFDWETTPFCTPWGPPVPPRLTRALRALLALHAKPRGFDSSAVVS